MKVSKACAPYSWGWIGPQLYGRSVQIQWQTWRRISISVGPAKKHVNEPAPSTNNDYGPISHHPYPFLVLGPILLRHGFPGLGFTLGTLWATMVFKVKKHCVQIERNWPSRQNATRKQNDRPKACTQWESGSVETIHAQCGASFSHMFCSCWKIGNALSEPMHHLTD